MKNTKKTLTSLIMVYLFFYTTTGLADLSIAAISDTLLVTTKGFSNFIISIMLVVGTGLWVGGFIQHDAYRKNPAHVPISRSIRLFLLGAVTLIFPIISAYSAGAYYLKNLS